MEDDTPKQMKIHFLPSSDGATLSGLAGVYTAIQFNSDMLEYLGMKGTFSSLPPVRPLCIVVFGTLLHQCVKEANIDYLVPGPPPKAVNPREPLPFQLLPLLQGLSLDVQCDELCNSLIVPRECGSPK